MRAVHSGNPPRVAGRKVGNIETEWLTALVRRQKRNSRSIRRDARKRGEVGEIAQPPRLGNARRLVSKLFTKSKSLVTLRGNPHPPFLRQALPSEELAHCGAARDDRTKTDGASSHPRGRSLLPVLVGEVIEEQASEHVMAIDRPGARIQFRLVQLWTFGLEHSRPERLRKSRTANAPTLGEPRLIERREPFNQVAAIEEVRKG